MDVYHVRERNLLGQHYIVFLLLDLHADGDAPLAKISSKFQAELDFRGSV